MMSLPIPAELRRVDKATYEGNSSSQGSLGAFMNSQEPKGFSTPQKPQCIYKRQTRPTCDTSFSSGMSTPNIFKESQPKKITKATPIEIDNDLMMSQQRMSDSVDAIKCCAERIAVATENMDKYQKGIVMHTRWIASYFRAQFEEKYGDPEEEEEEDKKDDHA